MSPQPAKGPAVAATTAQRLRAVMKSCRDIMRKDKGLNGDVDRLPMLTWMMFLKFLDDLERVRSDEAILDGRPYKETVDPPYRWRDWNPPNSQGTASGGLHNAMTGDALIAFVNQDEAVRPDGRRGPGLFSYLKGLEGSSDGIERRDVIASVFRGTVNRVQSGYILRDVLDKVNEIHFWSSDEIHTLSQLYESMLKEMRDAAGDSGEFYTPRALVRMIVKAIDPRPGETLLDPAAGTGGFLVEAYEHLRPLCETVGDFDQLQKRTVFGIEAKPLPYLLCQMNLLLHGLESPQIDPLNALRFRMSEIGDRDRVDVIMTNPPFGGEEEKGIQANFPEDRQSAETALLFLQLIMRKIRRPGRGSSAGGRAGVVVPNGTLSGDGVALRIRQDLLDNYNLHTIVRLPDGVFAPYTPIPTNVLFFDRSGPTESIWYYEHQLPEGRRSYTKTRPLEFDEFEPLLRWWGDRKETEVAWQVQASAVRENGYKLDLRNPNRSEGLAEVAPVKLLAESVRVETAVLDLLREADSSLNELGDARGSEQEKLAQGWRKLRLAKALSVNRDECPVDTGSKYPNIGLLSFGRGVFEKAPIDGAATSAKTLYRIKAGQFIYSRLFAFEGAYGVVPDHLGGYYVSNEFPVFDVDPKVTDGRFLATYFRSRTVWERLGQASRGLGNRRQRVHPEAVLALEVWLPPRELQREIVKQMARLSDCRAMHQQALVLLSALESSMLNQTLGLSRESV